MKEQTCSGPKYVTNARILLTDGQTLLTDKFRVIGDPAYFVISHDPSSSYQSRNETLITVEKFNKMRRDEKRFNSGHVCVERKKKIFKPCNRTKNLNCGKNYHYTRYLSTCHCIFIKIEKHFEHL